MLYILDYWSDQKAYLRKSHLSWDLNIAKVNLWRPKGRAFSTRQNMENPWSGEELVVFEALKEC